MFQTQIRSRQGSLRDHLFHLSSSRQNQGLGFLSLEKGRLWEDHRAAFQYLKGACGKAGVGM